MKSKVTKLEQCFRDEAQERPESFVAYDKTQYVWSIEFADGTKGKTSTPKDHPRFKEGEEASFTVERTVHGNKIKYVDEEKPAYDQSKPYSKGSKSNNASFACSYSKDIQVAIIRNGGTLNKQNMFELADEMLEWLNKNS